MALLYYFDAFLVHQLGISLYIYRRDEEERGTQMLSTAPTATIPTTGYAPTGPQDDDDEKFWGADPGPQDDDRPRSVVGPGAEDDDKIPFLMSSGGSWQHTDPLPGPSPEDNDGRPRMGSGTSNEDDEGREDRGTFMGVGPNDDDPNPGPGSKEGGNEWDDSGDWTGLLVA